MTKSFYQYANFSLGLIIAASLFQSMIHLQLGVDLYVLQSIWIWFLLVNLLSLVASFFLLTYYHHKKYRVAFVTGIAATLTTFCGYLFLFITLLDRDFAPYIIPNYYLVISVGIIYALSLIVSKTAERPWLKRAGVFSLLLGLVQLVILLWYMDSPPTPANVTFSSVRQWLSLVGSLLPVLFIMNFLSEIRLAKADNQNITLLNASEAVMGLVGLLALCTLILGVKLWSESYRHTHISEKARLLAQPFESGRYISSKGDTMLYRLLKPLHYDPQKKYPLVVCLPYSCANDNIRQIESCPPAQLLSRLENRTNYPAFLFVPRCPPGTGWGGIPYNPAVDSLAIKAIMALDKTLSIDVKRRYVTGVSRGGYGSWHFISTHPDMFAAAIPICGGGKPALARHLTNVSVWAFHGAQDKNVPVSGSRDMIEAIKKAGGKPRYTEYPNAAHGIWEDVEKTPDLLNWLFAQKRQD